MGDLQKSEKNIVALQNRQARLDNSTPMRMDKEENSYTLKKNRKENLHQKAILAKTTLYIQKQYLRLQVKYKEILFSFHRFLFNESLENSVKK